MNFTRLFLFLIISFSTIFQFHAQKTNPKNQPEELGKVAWYRDYNEALQFSKKEGKPVLILFQEVPGCSTCKNYGNQVLGHPLMAEAIQNEFIPLAIFNNKKGKDSQILEKYKEPSWNNPVVRIVNYKGENLVNRIAKDFSASTLYKAMEKALKLYGNPTPKYLDLLGQEVLAINNDIALNETYFKMYCFWSGEKELGSKEGVLATKAGFMEKNEVVRVIYDEKIISKSQLLEIAENNNMEPIAKTQFYWSKNDEDYYIQQSNYKYLPLTEIQKTKINSALGNGKSAKEYLSPQQLNWLKNLNTNNSPVLFNKVFQEAWEGLASKYPTP